MKNILLAIAMLFSVSVAQAQESAKPVDASTTTSSTSMSSAEIAWGKSMAACLKRETNDQCYMVERNGHLFGYCPVHKEENRDLFHKCEAEAKLATQPKRWTAN